MSCPAEAATPECVRVAVRIRPLSGKEAGQAAVWRPVAGVPGHVQLFNDKDEPVPKQLYAYGERAARRACAAAAWGPAAACAHSPA